MIEFGEIERINVVGGSASGKSIFSTKLSRALNIPHIQMDALFWGPEWRSSTDEELYAKLAAELGRRTWILDGNYSRTTPLKWERVDLVIWLDYSFPRTFWQSVTRAVRRARTQEELWEGTGNRESFRKTFLSRDSIVLWMLTNFRKIRRRYEAILADEQYAHIRFIRLRNPSEADALLELAQATCKSSNRQVADA